MKHKMKLTVEPYEKVASGDKVIESRLLDEKRKQIVVGDEIEFYEVNNQNNSVVTKVIGVLIYRSFKDLFNDHNPELFGEDSREFLLRQIKQFYSDEDEKKYGVVGIRIKLVDKNK